MFSGGAFICMKIQSISQLNFFMLRYNAGIGSAPRIGWETCKEHSKQFTDNASKLAFAMAAICWLFREEKVINQAKVMTFPTIITITLLLIVFYFLFDVTQHLTFSILMRRAVSKEEIRLMKENNVDVPDDMWEIKIKKSLHLPATILFYLKTAALYSAGFLLIKHFADIIPH
jgi:hypothetical protein